MSVLLVLGLVLAAVVMFRRRSRASVLAGLSSAKPQFMVEPPTRRLGKRSGERL